MRALTVAALFDSFHHDVFRSDEGQRITQAALAHFGINHQPARQINHNVQHRVGRQEGFRQGDAAVGRIIQRALAPLGAGRHGRILGQGDQMPAQRAGALGADGITLVGHGRGAYLRGSEGLFHFAAGLQQAHILRKAIAADAQ